MTEDATWGDFTVLAASRLEYALAALAEAETRTTPGRHAARSEALAGTCRLLHRYTGRYGPLAHDPLGITEDDVARLHGNLDTLGWVLWGESRYARHEPDAVSLHLTEAYRLLAVGTDVLASHHGPDGQPRSPYAAYLDSTGAARRIVAETAELASTAGRVAVRIGQLCPPDSRVIRSHLVARQLAEPAFRIEQAAIGIHRQLNTPRPASPAPGLTHLPAAATPPPSAVRPGETRREALLAVRAGMDWLAAHTAQQAAERLPGVTAVELSAAADSTAFAHLLSARLIEVTRDLLTVDPVGRDSLLSAAQSLRTATSAWQHAADSWQSRLRCAPEISTPRYAREAEFAFVRLGRTLFSSGWTPRDGGQRKTRDAREIITSPGDAALLLTAAHAIPATGQILAEHTPWIATTMVERGVLLSSDLAHNPRGGTPAECEADPFTFCSAGRYLVRTLPGLSCS
ncbi:hypothetical protein ACFVSN_40425 [Kitasatospora sp. NPDC057904]|uniref:hypothetical protein n=1 Tax=Kitasatospora sp. NPDC057904 TaxID=3346275 RepID=UPI0036D972B3